MSPVGVFPGISEYRGVDVRAEYRRSTLCRWSGRGRRPGFSLESPKEVGVIIGPVLEREGSFFTGVEALSTSGRRDRYRSRATEGIEEGRIAGPLTGRKQNCGQ